MKANAPLFVYDCDGTLELPLIFAYAQEKQRNKNFNMTLAEFKAAHPDEKKLMISGMADFVKYASKIGNVVLLSGGDPVTEGSKELKSLFPLFQEWKLKGEDVPFGREPTGMLKNNPEVAKGLREYFNPSKVIVVGDSSAECELAKNIKADVLLMRGTSSDLYQGLTSVHNKYSMQTGEEMENIVKKTLERRTVRRIRPRRSYRNYTHRLNIRHGSGKL